MYDNKETRICKKCGRELPLEEIAVHSRKDGIVVYKTVCKECKNKAQRQYRKDKKLQAFLADDSVKIKRKFKEVRSERILSYEQSGIIPISEDEIFVRLLDYRDTWISNYGRAVTRYGSKYSLMQRKTAEDGEIAYQLYRNIYDGKKWTYEKRLVKAWTLVVQEFIVNYDMANNKFCWHTGGNVEDNYYKSLYPLNEYQYGAVKRDFEEKGIDSEEHILEIVNSLEYKPDGWEPEFMLRSVCEVGYRGGNVDCYSTVYRKWLNMMQRCYYEKVHEYKPYYAPCTVCEEWHNFSNFKFWYDENNIEGRKFDLDKDIMVQGNTVYGPDTCALITHYGNTIFEKRRGVDSSIVKNPLTGKYDTSMILLGKKKEVGSFDTEEEARKEFFDYKSNYIGQYARKSKSKVPDKVYQAMLRWDVKLGY